MSMKDSITNGSTVSVKCIYYKYHGGCLLHPKKFDCGKIFEGCRGIHYISWTEYLINSRHLIEVKDE